MTRLLLAVAIVLAIVPAAAAVEGGCVAMYETNVATMGQAWADHQTYEWVVDADGSYCLSFPQPGWERPITVPTPEPCAAPDYQDTTGVCVPGPHQAEGYDGAPVPFVALPTDQDGGVVWELVPDDPDPYLASWVEYVGGRPAGRNLAL